jgi:hypothetical protein
MRQILLALLIVVGASAANAQTTAPRANPNPSMPAIANPDKNNEGAPARGANSFTERQAKARIQAAGYSNIGGLTKDKDGIWRGKGAKGGTIRNVTLDYQGNVVAR